MNTSNSIGDVNRYVTKYYLYRKVCFNNTVVMVSGTSQGYFAFENNKLFVFIASGRISITEKPATVFKIWQNIPRMYFVILSNSIFSHNTVPAVESPSPYR